MLGGLVALVWKPKDEPVEVHLGVIASASRELVDHVRQYQDTLFLRISLFDASVQLRVLRELRSPSSNPGQHFLIESPVLYDSVKPFLEALCRVPEDIPFSDYLVLQSKEDLKKRVVAPPRYAAMPGFRYNLSSLFDDDKQVSLDVRSEESFFRARKMLETSRLDPSQADAVMDTLTREVALIQGYVFLISIAIFLTSSTPPGHPERERCVPSVRNRYRLTYFKSYTGVEILRVLIANKIGPIVLIAFTNHALDHMLSSVLDKKITEKIVRLGRRSKDERMAQYSLEELETKHGQSQLSHSVRVLYRQLKQVEEDMDRLMGQVKNTSVQWTDILEFLKKTSTPHLALLVTPPAPVLALHEIWLELEDGYTTVGKGKRKETLDKTCLGFWLGGGDLVLVGKVFDGSYAPWVVAQPEAVDVQPKGQPEVEEDGGDEEDDDNDNEEDDTSPEGQWKKRMLFEEEKEPIALQPTFLASSTPSLSQSSQVNGDDTGPYGQWKMHMSFEEDNQPIPLQSTFLASSTPEPSQGPIINDAATFFASLGFSQSPTVPYSNRPLQELLLMGGEVWSMSPAERKKLHQHWATKTRESKMMEYEEKYESLRTEHETTVRLWNEAKNTVRTFLFAVDGKQADLLCLVPASRVVKLGHHRLYD